MNSDVEKYRLEQDTIKYAPHVPEIQTLLVPPKGKWCNADYKFCPDFEWGGYCRKSNEKLMSVDGCEFTTVKSKFGDHDIAVGSYTVYKKKCGVK